MGSKPEWSGRTEPAVGDRWVYRRGVNDDLAQVKVLRVGVRRPSRLLVRFVSDEFEGLQDWVPPSRLKALWRDVDEYAAWHARWRELMSDAPDHDSRLLRAAEVAIGALLPESAIGVGWNYTIGVAFIDDVPALAEELGVSQKWFGTDDRSFFEGSTLVAPWPTTLAIAQAAASRHPRAILRWIEVDEARARQDAIHGRHDRFGSKYGSWSISGEEAAALDAEHSAPVRDLLRQWIGAEQADHAAELAAMREEARRLDALASAAFETLRHLGHKRQATMLEHKFAKDVHGSGEARRPSVRGPCRALAVSTDQGESFRLPRVTPEFLASHRTDQSQQSRQPRPEESESVGSTDR